jgi:hypothetical protein
MKRIIVLLFLLTAIGWPQRKEISLSIIRPEFITVNLDSTASSVVYYIYPPPAGDNATNRTPISTTIPTSASAQAINLEYNASGALTLSIVTDSVTADESDSLYVSVATLLYDKTKATWYVSTNDVQYLDLDTPGTYFRTTIQYLNWTHGLCYTADFSGNVMPGAGLAVTVGQVTNDEAGAATNLYLGFWWVR